MTKYGRATIRALELSIMGIPPHDAWKQATEELFPNSPTGRDKGCPKGAFLGLCQEGYVKGIAPRKCTDSLDNSGLQSKQLRFCNQIRHCRRTRPFFGQ